MRGRSQFRIVMAKKCEQLDAARLNGEARYFTGLPCKNGHVAERITANKTCVECIKLHTKKHNSKESTKERILAWLVANEERAKESRKKWKENNADKVLEYNRKWLANHPEKQKAANANWRENNQDKIKATTRVYLKNNRHKPNANEARRRAAKKMAKPSWANDKYIALFYELAQIESIRIGSPVDVDHIIPLQNDLVCGLHCEDNLQLLTASANRKKCNSFHVEGANDG